MVDYEIMSRRLWMRNDGTCYGRNAYGNEHANLTKIGVIDRRLDEGYE